MTREETGQASRLIPGSKLCVTSRILFFFYHGSVYMTPGLLATDGVHLSQRGQRIFAHELAGFIQGAIN